MHFFFWSQHVATMDWCTYPVTQHLTSRFLWDTAVIVQLRPQTTIGVTSTPRTPRRHLSWAVNMLGSPCDPRRINRIQCCSTQDSAMVSTYVSTCFHSMNLEASGPFGPCKPKWFNNESTSKPKGPHLCILDVAGVVVTASAQQDEIWQVMKWYELHLTSFNLSHDKLRVTKRNGKCPMRRSGRAKSSPKGQLKDAERCWKMLKDLRRVWSLYVSFVRAPWPVVWIKSVPHGLPRSSSQL
jgi:hypothetical protein